MLLFISFVLQVFSESENKPVKIIETIKNETIEYEIQRSIDPFKYVKYLKPIKIEPIPLKNANKNTPIDTFVSLHSYIILGNTWDEIASHIFNPPDLKKFHKTKQEAFEDTRIKSINDIIQILGILFYEDKEILIFSSSKSSSLGIEKSAQYFVKVKNQYYIFMDDEIKIKFLDYLAQNYWEMDNIISELVKKYGKETRK